MKTPLANKAALAIIRSVEANPAMQFETKHSTAQRIAEVIATETAADELLDALQAVLAWLIEKEEGSSYKAQLQKPVAVEKARAAMAAAGVDLDAFLKKVVPGKAGAP